MEQNVLLSRIEEEIPVTKIKHTTCIKVKQYEFEWKIKNLQYWNQSDDEEIYLKSPSFYTSESDNEDNLGFEWILVVYPPDYNEISEDHISVKIHLTNKPEETEKIFKEVQVQLSLIDADGDRIYVKRQLFTPKELYTGNAIFAKFIKKDILFGMTGVGSKAFMPDGEITILCKLFFNRGFYHNIRFRKMQDIPAERCLLDDNDFKVMLENPKFSDMNLVVGDKKFSVHKIVLSTRSRAFAAMFEADDGEQVTNTVTINDFDAEVIHELLRFIYVGKVENIQKLGRELLLAAEKYNLKSLQAICEQVVIDSINEENIADILIIVNKCSSAQKLKASATDFLNKNVRSLANKENFKDIFNSLSPELLTDVVRALVIK